MSLLQKDYNVDVFFYAMFAGLPTKDFFLIISLQKNHILREKKS